MDSFTLSLPLYAKKGFLEVCKLKVQTSSLGVSERCPFPLPSASTPTSHHRCGLSYLAALGIYVSINTVFPREEGITLYTAVQLFVFDVSWTPLCIKA